MSLNNLTSYNPLTINGLDSLNIDGNPFDPNNYISKIDPNLQYMNGSLDMGLNKIQSASNPSSNEDYTNKNYVDTQNSAQDAIISTKASISYVDTQDALRVLKSGDTMTGTLDMASNKITSSYVPLNNDDLTNKNYVDTQDNAILSSISTDYLNKSIISSQTVNGPVSFQSTISSTDSITAVNFYTNSGYNWTRPNANSYDLSISRISNSGIARDLLIRDNTSNADMMKLSADGQIIYTGLTCDYTTADKIPIFNSDKKLVSSGVDSIKITYLDNVSSDIQNQLNTLSTDKASISYVDTQDGLRVLKSGDTMTGTLNMGANKITTSYVPVNNEDVANKAYVDAGGIGVFLALTGGTMSGSIDMGANKITTTYSAINNEDVITKGYGDSAYATSSALSGYLPLTGGTLTGNLSSNTGTLVNFGEALKTVATDKGYTGASFTVSSSEVPAGVQTGTLSGTYRLTSLSGYAVMAMAIADLNATYQSNEYYTFTFTGIVGSVPLTLTVYQNTTPRVAVNITTSPQTITRTFTTGTGSGKIYFNFQALSANPYVDWTGFTMTRTDTQVNGFFRANGSVGIGTNTPDTTLNVVGKGKFHDGNVSAPVVGVNGGAGTRLILWPGTVSAYAYALGIDANTLWYGVPSSGNHRWYDGGTERMTLTTFLDVKGGIRSYANGVGGPAFIYAENANAGDAYSVIYLRNNNSGTGCYWFMNSTTRSVDGGANTATLRNDAGRLRLQGAQAYGIQIYNNGAVGIEGASPYAISNNFMSRGSLTLGSIDQNYGGGTGQWNASTAGILMECLTHTEIAVHDAGQRVVSLMYFVGDATNRIYIGRDMGYGTTPTTFRGAVSVEAGDGSQTYYGPNGSWGAYLLVGSRPTGINSNTAQVISTTGNIHIDSGFGKSHYYGYYVRQSGYVPIHYLYGRVYAQDDWFRLGNNYYGLYWENLGRGICSPEGGGNTYGTICTYLDGRNGWAGYGLRDRYCLMSGAGGDGGIHDNSYGWLIYWPGYGGRDTIIGGGSTMGSRNWDLFVVWRTGNSYDWSNGYFYFNQGGGYGYSSDSRLKDNIQPIQANESITFLKHLQPSSFCMKEARPVEVEKADKTKETIHPECCTCEQDGFIADNVWEAVVASGASKSVLNNWSGWLEEMKKPEDERTLSKDTILGVCDRPILSHTVNVVKTLMERVEILEAREKIWVEHAKIEEQKLKNAEDEIKTIYKDFDDYKKLTEERFNKLISLIIKK